MRSARSVSLEFLWWACNHPAKRKRGASRGPRELPCMLYKTLSAAVYGIDANLIEVEVDVAPVKSR